MKCRSQPGAAGRMVVRRAWSVIGGGCYLTEAVWRENNWEGGDAGEEKS